MQKRRGDPKQKTPIEKAYSDFSPGAVPVGPGGGIQPGYGAEPPYEPYDESQFICLQGPCRHLWEIEVSAGAGNPEGTWEELGIREPRHRSMSCILHPGLEIELSRDEMVFDCNRWDPVLPAENLLLEERRRQFREQQKAEAAEEPQEEIDDDEDEESAPE